MSLIKDGPKRVGKFFKKGHRILKTVSLMDYSFEEIRQSAVVDFDNINRTIIHAKLHEKSVVDLAVQPHSTFNESLLDPSQQNPVIFPADFTKDWQAEKLNRKRRVLGFEDEDDFDFESNSAPEVSFHAPRRTVNDANATAQTSGDDEQLKVPPTSDELSVGEESIHSAPAPAGHLTQMTKVDIMSKALKEIMESDQKVFNTSAQSDFKPLMPDVKISDQSEELQKNIEVAKSEAKRQGHEEGYAEGLRLGKAESEAQVKQAAAQLFSKMSEIIKDLGNLKSSVLVNIQKNFYELSQAIVEALVQKELAMSPESFARLVHRVVNDTVKSDQFKVHVNPETFAEISRLDDALLKQHLVQDESVVKGEFKIESDLTRVDVNVSKIVKDLLDQADLGLFANQPVSKKAG